jgi:hypothetical protein
MRSRVCELNARGACIPAVKPPIFFWVVNRMVNWAPWEFVVFFY